MAYSVIAYHVLLKMLFIIMVELFNLNFKNTVAEDRKNTIILEAFAYCLVCGKTSGSEVFFHTALIMPFPGPRTCFLAHCCVM